MRYLQLFIVYLFFYENTALFEGDDCILTETTEAGKCTGLDNCDYAIKLIRLNRRPQHCGFKRNTPVVCCPLKTLTTSSKKSRSEEKCAEYYNSRTEQPEVAGGTRAFGKEFPHMVALGYADESGNISNIAWLCGGSLISDRFILTAAHCANSGNFGEPLWARLGELNLHERNDDAAPQNIALKNIFLHPLYKPPSHYNDIALIKLERSVHFNPYIKPACLHNEKKLPNYSLQAIGWGKTDFFGESSSHLMKVTLSKIDHGACNTIYNNISQRKLRKGIIDDLQICAGDTTGKDTCPGDSGGPLHFLQPVNRSLELEQHFVIVGVTSFGRSCGLANSAGVYTRVSSYIPWIEDTVWPL